MFRKFGMILFVLLLTYFMVAVDKSAHAASCAGPAPSGSDDTSAINTAIGNCSGPLVLQAGTYSVSGTINLRAVNNAGLIGMGQGTCGSSAGGTQIKSTITTGTVIQGASSVTGQTVSGLNILRSSNGTSGSRGFDSGTGQTGAQFSDICSQNSNVNCYFHDADTTSNIEFINCNNGPNDGIWMTSPGINIGYNTQVILAANNTGNGITINPVYGGGTSGSLTGKLHGFNTASNSGDGLWMSSVTAATFIGSFPGDDSGAVEIYIYNSSPTFLGLYTELVGGTYGLYQLSGGTTTCYDCVAAGSATTGYAYDLLSGTNFYMNGGGNWMATRPIYLSAGNFYAHASKAIASTTLTGSGVTTVVSSYWGSYTCNATGGCNTWGNF